MTVEVADVVVVDEVVVEPISLSVSKESWKKPNRKNAIRRQ